jgi:hypothetical protein
MNTRIGWPVPALVLVFALSGCGGPLVKVTGRLTYKGQPVPSTTLTFTPEEEGKRPSHGVTDDDGNFTLRYSSTEVGALTGKFTVTLRYHMTADEETHTIPPKASKELRAVIQKYSNPSSSPLHYEITKSGQVVDIKLE